MPHRYNKTKTDPKKVKALILSTKWHEALNDDLIKMGKKPEPNMVDAIKKNAKYGNIGEKTIKMANEIRIEGNKARHEFKNRPIYKPKKK